MSYYPPPFEYEDNPSRSFIELTEDMVVEDSDTEDEPEGDDNEED